MSETVRLTVAQATVRFLANQWTERDGVERRFFAGCFGIFGYGNAAGMGQALLENELDALGRLPDGLEDGDPGRGRAFREPQRLRP